jgi:hypothetical protein
MPYCTTREHAPGKTLTVPCGCVYAWVCADSSGRIHELVLYVQWSVYKLVYVRVYVYVSKSMSVLVPVSTPADAQRNLRDQCYPLRQQGPFPSMHGRTTRVHPIVSISVRQTLRSGRGDHRIQKKLSTLDCELVCAAFADEPAAPDPLPLERVVAAVTPPVEMAAWMRSFTRAILSGGTMDLNTSHIAWCRTIQTYRWNTYRR